MQSEFRFAVWMRKVPGVCVPDPLCARGQGAWLWLMLSAGAVCGAGSSCSPSRGEKKNLLLLHLVRAWSLRDLGSLTHDAKGRLLPLEEQKEHGEAWRRADRNGRSDRSWLARPLCKEGVCFAWGLLRDVDVIYASTIQWQGEKLLIFSGGQRLEEQCICSTL